MYSTQCFTKLDANWQLFSRISGDVVSFRSWAECQAGGRAGRWVRTLGCPACMSMSGGHATEVTPLPPPSPSLFPHCLTCLLPLPHSSLSASPACSLSLPLHSLPHLPAPSPSLFPHCLTCLLPLPHSSLTASPACSLSLPLPSLPHLPRLPPIRPKHAPNMPPNTPHTPPTRPQHTTDTPPTRPQHASNTYIDLLQVFAL